MAISITKYAYLRNTEGTRYKDYYVGMFSNPPSNKHGWIATWGRIGRDGLGFRTFSTKYQVDKLINDKISTGGYKNSGEDWSIKEKYAANTLIRLAQEHNTADDFINTVANGTTYTSKGARGQYGGRVKAPDPIVDYSDVKSALSKIREYLEINPDDHAVMDTAKAIGEAVGDIGKIQTILQESGLSGFILNEKIMAVVFTVLANPAKVKDYLRNLDSGKVSALSDKEKEFLRSLWKRDTFTLKQIHWLCALQEKIYSSWVEPGLTPWLR